MFPPAWRTSNQQTMAEGDQVRVRIYLMLQTDALKVIKKPGRK